MDQKQVNKIMYQMTDVLDNTQMMYLKKVLEDLSSDEITEDDSKELLERFIATKKLEGRSERTLKYYKNTIDKMMNVLEKNVRTITTDDLRHYLADYQMNSNASKMSIDNIRRNLSSFFNWLEDENYILKSPVRRIHKIKTTTAVKEAYSDDEMERLRDSCIEIRDLAIIDLLASTGMRVGELVLLNQEDIDFNERECIVLGKGDKERIVYFDARTKLHLQEYLQSRNDDNVALFVGRRTPHKRVTINGVELGRGLGAIHSKDGHQSFVLYTMFALKEVLDVYNAEGTVFGSINRDALNKMEIKIPSRDVIDEFEDVVSKIDLMIRRNYEETCNLVKLRDSMLPKLMSGELDVSELDI